MAKVLSVLGVIDPTTGGALLEEAIALLQNPPAHLYLATSLAEAIQLLHRHQFDLIVIELTVGDSRGVGTFVEIHKRAEKSPIIVLGEEEEEMGGHLLRLGAQDFLPKEVFLGELAARSMHNAMERQYLQTSLQALSFTDELTGLYNRRGFLTLLEQQIALTRRTHKGFYLFVLDLDYLKKINDTYGHLAGDHALIETANCLRTSFRHHDIIGRLGGDEFAAIAINAAIQSGEHLKKHLQEKVTEYNARSEVPYKLAFSVGSIYYDALQESSLEELLAQADQELYLDKRHHHARPL